MTDGPILSHDAHPSARDDILDEHLSWRRRARLRKESALAPRWWERLRSVVMIVVMVAALGLALAALVGLIALAVILVVGRATG